MSVVDEVAAWTAQNQPFVWTETREVHGVRVTVTVEDAGYVRPPAAQYGRAVINAQRLAEVAGAGRSLVGRGVHEFQAAHPAPDAAAAPPPARNDEANWGASSLQLPAGAAPMPDGGWGGWDKSL